MSNVFINLFYFIFFYKTTFSVLKNANTVDCNASKYEEKPINLINLFFANVHLLLLTNLRVGNSKKTIVSKFSGIQDFSAFFIQFAKKCKFAQLMAH